MDDPRSGLDLFAGRRHCEHNRLKPWRTFGFTIVLCFVSAACSNGQAKLAADKARCEAKYGVGKCRQAYDTWIPSQAAFPIKTVGPIPTVTEAVFSAPPEPTTPPALGNVDALGEHGLPSELWELHRPWRFRGSLAVLDPDGPSRVHHAAELPVPMVDQKAGRLGDELSAVLY
jgi:hypothetical protein